MRLPKSRGKEDDFCPDAGQHVRDKGLKSFGVHANAGAGLDGVSVILVQWVDHDVRVRLVLGAVVVVAQ